MEYRPLGDDADVLSRKTDFAILINEMLSISFPVGLTADFVVRKTLLNLHDCSLRMCEFRNQTTILLQSLG